MSEVVKRLQERRLNVWEQAKTLADNAAGENRAFSGEEQGTWDSLNSELNALDQRIDSMLQGEQRAKDAEDAFAKLNGKTPTGPQGSQESGNELRAFLRGEPGAPRTYEVKPNGPVNFRDLSKVAPATQGSNTVPTSFYDRLMAHLIETASMLRGGATVLNTSSGESLQVPKTLTHGTGALVAETIAIAEADPTFGQLTLGAYKYGVMIQVSNELVSDTGVDLEGYLSMQAGRAIGNALGSDLVIGNGTNKPRGITIDTTLGVTGTTPAAGGAKADELIDLYYSVIEPYRNSSACSWVMRDATVAQVRKIKDSTNQYIWQPGLQAGAPDLLLGKPILTDPYMPATGISTKSILFGDLSQYFVRLAGGFRFERSDDFAFNQDLVSFRALVRGDGALVDLTGAVKHYVGFTA